MTLPRDKNVVCRGIWALGTACGRCKRCAETRPGISAPAPTAEANRKLRKKLAEALSELDLARTFRDEALRREGAVKAELEALRGTMRQFECETDLHRVQTIARANRSPEATDDRG